MSTFRVAVVGAGPRGTSLVERIGAAFSSGGAADGGPDAEVHLFDPLVGRGGAVWRFDQTRALLMNTVTAETTLFVDDSIAVASPAWEGPTLADWLALVRASDPGVDVSRQSVATDVVVDARQLGPGDFASRALYGSYLAWVLDAAEERYAPALRLTRHPRRVVAITDEGPIGGPQRVVAEDGTATIVDAVVLANGHLSAASDVEPGPVRTFARASGLPFLGPANPLEIEYERLTEGSRVAVMGMGLNFYDALAMLTSNRGGRFVRAESDPNALVYVPSGAEPFLYVGSRSGMPYRPKGIYPLTATPPLHELRVVTTARVTDMMAAARRGTAIDFARDLWPLIEDELEIAFRTAGAAPDRDLRDELFPLGAIRRAPLATVSGHVTELLRDDLARARDAAHDPWHAVSRAVAAVRTQVQRLTAAGAFRGESWVRDVDGRFKNEAASWASGPPLLRVEQLVALADAGIVTFLGPGMRIEPDSRSGCFRASGALIEGPGGTQTPLATDAVLAAFLPPADLERYDDALMRDLLTRGDLRSARSRSSGDNRGALTGSVDVTVPESGGPFHPYASDGAAHPGRYVLGVPAEHSQPNSQISPAPRTGAVLLVNTDRVAADLRVVALKKQSNLPMKESIAR